MLKLSNFLVLVFAIIVSWGTHSLADNFEILLSDDERSIIVKAGKEELEIGIGENCDVISDGGNYGFTDCQSQIGDLEMSKVSAQLGSDGVGFSLDNGLTFGDLELGAGELQFAMMTGDQIANIVELPDVVGDLKDDNFYLFTDVSSALEVGIGDNAISLPSPVDISASLLLDLTGSLLFYSGPIPSPVMIVDGANKFIKSASMSGDTDKGILSGAFGYSVYPAFKFESVHELYQSSDKDPSKEDFKANAVLIGEFDLAGFAAVEGSFFLDVKKGHLGLNGNASVSFDMFGAGISLDVAEGTFLVDGDGVRFGLGSTPSESLPDELKYISQFATPALNASSNAYGLAKTDGDFLVRMDVENISSSGIDSIDGSFTMSPTGLAMDSKFQLDGVGKVKVAGEITKTGCTLTAEKIKIFNLWEIKDASVEFCEMAKEGAYAFAGEIKILGISAMASGVSDVADSAAAVLSKDLKFREDFELKKKFGVGGSGIAGGYVKLTAGGEVDVVMNAASGSLSSNVDLDAKAKFCGKVKIKGFKRKKCSSTTSGIENSLDVESGCFTFDAEKKVLGKKFKIDAGKVCPFPAANKDKAEDENDDLNDGDELDPDDLGIVVALKDQHGEYVMWTDELLLTTTKNLGDTTYFTLLNKDGSECPKDGGHIAVQLGDGTDEDLENYWRVKKDKSSALNAQSGDEDSGTKAKKRFIIYAVDMANECLSDGDTIRLRNKEYKRWVSSASKPLVAYNSSGGDDKVFTVVFEPKE